MNENYGRNDDRRTDEPLYSQVMRDSAAKQTMGSQIVNQAMRDAQNVNRAMEPANEISRRAYNIIMGLIILWGVGLDTAICVFFGDRLLLSFYGNWWWILVYIGLTIGGTIIVNVSKNPVLSFFGYNLIVVGFGVTLAMIVGLYMPAIVLEAFLVTTIVTALMLLLGTLWQDFFKRIGVVLFVGLIGVIIVEVVMLLFTGTYPTWISVVSAILFSGFIGYDWAKAQEAPSTVKNAVSFATALYVDIINLFLDILRVLGDR